MGIYLRDPYEVILEDHVAEVIKTTRNLAKSIKSDVLNLLTSLTANPVLEEVDFKVFAPKGLKESEVRALILFSLILRDTLVGWKIQEFLDENYLNSENQQLALLLGCRSIEEAIYRLSSLNQNILVTLKRNLKDNISTGLRKLRIFKRTKTVKYPQRKRGYNDKGSMDKDSAWKEARAFWLDTEQHNHLEYVKQVRKDTLAFLQGFTD